MSRELTICPNCKESMYVGLPCPSCSSFTVQEFLPGDMPRVGVLSPGDRLLIVVDLKTTVGYVERLVKQVQQQLPGVPVLVIAADGVIIDKTGAAS